MSDAIERTSCIRHRAQGKFFVFYEDLQDIAKGKHADKINAFIRVLEVRTNKRLNAHEEAVIECKNRGVAIPRLNLWIELTYADFIKFSLGLFKRSSFQIADKEAEKLLFCKSNVGKRHRLPDDPDSALVDYKEYILVIENVQAALDGKEPPITGDYFEKYGTDEYTPPVENNRGVLQKTPPLLKSAAPPVENNRNKNLIESSLKSSSSSSSDGEGSEDEEEMRKVSSEWGVQEAVVSLIEELRGMPYGEDLRQRELAAARKFLALRYQGRMITREEFIRLWNDAMVDSPGHPGGWCKQRPLKISMLISSDNAITNLLRMDDVSGKDPYPFVEPPTRPSRSKSYAYAHGGSS